MKEMKKLLAALCLFLSVLLVVPVIVPGVPDNVTVEAATKIKLNKTKATLVAGNTLQLKLSKKTGKVTWSSSKKSVATVSKQGKVTAKKKGTATITAKMSGKKYNCKITVKKKVALKSISLNTTSLTLNEDDTYKLNVQYIPKNTTDNKEVTWKSSNDFVADVEEDGTIYAYSAGTTTITAKVGSKKATCKITVKESSIYVSSIVLNKSNIELTSGETSTLTAIVYPNNATFKNVKWTTSNSSVATVYNGVVSAVAPGTAMITATATDGSGLSASCLVTVIDSVANNMNYLKNYILTYGSMNSSGNYFIKYQNASQGTSYGIVYESLYDRFLFIESMDTDLAQSTVTMYLYLDNNGIVSPEYILVYHDINLGCQATANVNIKNYNSDQIVHFDLINSAGGLTESDIQEVANAGLKSAFSGWELLLQLYPKMSLSDIGFTSYY